MPYGYVIAQINVTDPERYTDYVAMASKLVEQFGGEFLVRGGRGESFEGTPPGERNVVIRFPDVKTAQKWYHSEEYAEAKALRMSGSSSVQTIVEGV